MEAAMGASLITILAATVASWMFGAAWYGVLSRQWMAAAGMSEEDVRGPNGKADPSPFIISFVLEFVMAYVLAVLLMHTSDGEFGLASALMAGFIIWFGFIFSTQTINHRYSMKPWSLTLIDNGHWLGVLLVQAAVMALMGL